MFGTAASTRSTVSRKFSMFGGFFVRRRCDCCFCIVFLAFGEKGPLEVDVAVEQVVLAAVGVIVDVAAAAGVWNGVGKGLVREDRAESNSHGGDVTRLCRSNCDTFGPGGQPYKDSNYLVKYVCVESK